MGLIDEIVEKRIQDAIERGDFDELPGAGNPLELDDDRLVPEELRAGYRLLRNAGYVPEELRLRNEISRVEELIAMTHEPEMKCRALLKLRLLETRLDLNLHTSLLTQEAHYRSRLIRLMEET